MRRPISLKPNTYTESTHVDATGISGKETGITRGYLTEEFICAMDELGTHDAFRKGVSWKLSSCGKEKTTGIVIFRDKPSEVSRGHSSHRKMVKG